MCGRFVQILDNENLKELFNLKNSPDNIAANYNLAPSQDLLSIMVIDNKKQLIPLKWGLIPSWAKDANIGYTMINARLETVADKPAFKHAFKKNRILILANGFYEWVQEASTKKPYFIHYKNKELVAFAGLAEFWVDPDSQQIVKSCTIITTQSNEFMQKYHQRMPVVVDKTVYDDWLNNEITDKEKLLALLSIYDYSEMSGYPVGLEVNSPKNNNPDLLKPL